jgi:hypothetical protein
MISICRKMHFLGWLLALAMFVCLANQSTRGQTVSSCGCMDIVFVQDTTGSMGPPINNVKAGLANIVNAAVIASGGDVRFGLVTYSAPGGCGGDGVEVNQPFTTSIPTITAAIGALFASGGCGEPESSDEALKYTVTGATACSLLTPLGPLGPYRSDCVKIAIVDTDARPGGCDDTFTPGVDDVNAANDAAAAATAGIKVSAIYNETSTFFSPTIVPIMQTYATVTGGEYVQTPADGSGTGAGIADIIAHCGGAASLSCDVLLYTNGVQVTDNLCSSNAPVGVNSADPVEVVVVLNASAGNQQDLSNCVIQVNGAVTTNLTLSGLLLPGESSTNSVGIFHCSGGEVTDVVAFASCTGVKNGTNLTTDCGIAFECCRPPCTLTCSPAMVVSNDPGQCGAVVNYPAPTISGDCGTVTCSPASGSTFPVGTTTVTCTATVGEGVITNCSFTVTVRDTEPPKAECVPTTNPAGSTIPPAGNNPPSGKNPDGFYQLVASDNCDAAARLKIFVKDSAQGPCGGAFSAGPYAPGTKVKLTQSPGQQSVKPMAGVITAHINTKGDPVLVVTDSAGNTTCHKCFVPPPPK